MTSFSKSLNSLLFVVFFSFLLGLDCYGQAKIAPIALYMNDNDQTARIVVRNTADQPVEVNIDLLYGYPATNSEGKVFLKKFKEAPAGEPSANSWVRTYPRHITIPENEQQTIRFAARPPAQLPDGEYWARPAVSVRKIGKRTISDNGNQNVEAKLQVIQRTILSLNYRKGNVRTGVEINNLSSRYNNNTLYVNAEMQRKGNAAYLGHLNISLIDASGDQKKHHREEIAVYHQQHRQFEIDAKGLAPGRYQVEFSLDTRERHRENSDILRARSVKKTATVTVK